MERVDAQCLTLCFAERVGIDSQALVVALREERIGMNHRTMDAFASDNGKDRIATNLILIVPHHRIAHERSQGIACRIDERVADALQVAAIITHTMVGMHIAQRIVVFGHDAVDHQLGVAKRIDGLGMTQCVGQDMIDDGIGTQRIGMQVERIAAAELHSQGMACDVTHLGHRVALDVVGIVALHRHIVESIDGVDVAPGLSITFLHIIEQCVGYRISSGTFDPRTFVEVGKFGLCIEMPSACMYCRRVVDNARRTQHSCQIVSEIVAKRVAEKHELGSENLVVGIIVGRWHAAHTLPLIVAFVGSALHIVLEESQFLLWIIPADQTAQMHQRIDHNSPVGIVSLLHLTIVGHITRVEVGVGRLAAMDQMHIVVEFAKHRIAVVEHRVAIDEERIALPHLHIAESSHRVGVLVEIGRIAIHIARVLSELHITTQGLSVGILALVVA